MATRQCQPKPFPHRCPECGATEVYPEQTNHKTAFKYEGQLYEFEAQNITLNKCRNCGGVILPNTALEQIAEAFRIHAKLLTAEKIRGELQRLKLSQKEFAELLAVAQETVSRWLTSVQIQTRSLDRLMRLFFKSSDVRKDLAAMNAGVSASEATSTLGRKSSQGCHVVSSVPRQEPCLPAIDFTSPARFTGRISAALQDRAKRFELMTSF